MIARLAHGIFSPVKEKDLSALCQMSGLQVQPWVSRTDRTMNRKKLAMAIFLVGLLLLLSTPLLAVEVGDKAPDFELPSTRGGKLKLSSLRGKNVLINFYLTDYSPT
jgi:hypothetical protein